MKLIQPWFWRSLPLATFTGSQVFSKLFLPNIRNQPSSQATHQNIAVLLESPYSKDSSHSQLARYSICAGSPRIVDGQVQMWTPPLGEILPLLRQLLETSKNSPELNQSSIPDDLPFTGGWLGWLGYDLAREIELIPQIKADALPFPIAFWYEPASFAVLDHWEQILWLAASDRAELDCLQYKLEQDITATQEQESQVLESIDFKTSQLEYEQAVRQAKKYIHAGDIFQTNLSLRFQAYTSADSWQIYRRLHQINPSPFASYWHTPWGAVISCSPERLIQLKDQQAQTRPIAGTRSRGISPTLDQQLAQELMASTKDRAEHIMLVDLERNDLGKVCDWGSVKVDELLTIELYSHVMHLVSNVTGKLRAECDPIDLIRAVFPGGTITGCPKVRCMEIIEELEPVRRNLFYGSCGYLDWRGNLDLNILIRTLLLSPQQQMLSNQSSAVSTLKHSLNTVWGQVGAGIVADSDPETEWYESLSKAQAQLAALKNVDF